MVCRQATRLLPSCGLKWHSIATDGRSQRSPTVVGLMRDGNDGVDAAADIEVGDQLHGAGLAGLDEVVQDPVRDRLMKVALVPEGPEVEFERFQLDAQLVRDIGERQGREVRLAGLRAEAGKLRTGHVDLVIAPGLRIGERLKRFRWLRRHSGSFPSATLVSASELAARSQIHSSAFLLNHISSLPIAQYRQFRYSGKEFLAIRIDL